MRKLLRQGIVLFSVVCLLASCAKEYSLETGSGGTPATGALVKDANGNCSGITIHGTYDAGITMNDSNYAEISLTINKPGSYYISTDTLNGISFVDSGYFSVVGSYKVKLGAAGTPILPITSDFTVSFDTTTCGFSVTASDGGGSGDPNLSTTAWQFSDATNSYNGTIDTAYFSTEAGGVNAFTIVGRSATNADTTFRLVMALSTARTLNAGDTYTTTATADYLFAKASTSTEIYAARPNNAASGSNVTIVITSYNNTTRIAQGTFSGPAVASAGGTVNVSGQFRARVSIL